MTVVAISLSVAALSVMRWAEEHYLFMLGMLTFIAASLGRMARRRLWRGWARWHISGMGFSYVLLLTAFYVDNGKQLPLWKNLPVWTYWTLPTLVAAPIMSGHSCDTHWYGIEFKATPRQPKMG